MDIYVYKWGYQLSTSGNPTYLSKNTVFLIGLIHVLDTDMLVVIYNIMSYSWFQHIWFWLSGKPWITRYWSSTNGQFNSCLPRNWWIFTIRTGDFCQWNMEMFAQGKHTIYHGDTHTHYMNDNLSLYLFIYIFSTKLRKS